MEFQDQSAKELILNLSSTKIDTTPLTVLLESNVSTENVKINYGIIGASHFAIIEKSNGEIISEIFACVDLQSDDEIHSYKMDVLQEKILSNQFNSLNHQFECHCIYTDDTLFKYEFDKHLSKAQEYGLIYTFPKREQDIFDPLTTIVVTNDDVVITVETMHAYPNESVIIITKTIIKIGE